MDDIAKRVTNLSPTKRTLLELKLRKLVSPKSSEGKSAADDIVTRVAGLSLTKRTLLELKLRKKAATKLSEHKPAANDIARRVASLSSTKRALLELKLRKKEATASLADKPATDDISSQIAHLSPAKRALLESRLKKKVDDVSGPTIGPPPSIPPETETSDEEVITTEPADEPTSTTSDAEAVAEPEASDWLTDLMPEELETPAWLLDDVSDEEEVVVQTQPQVVEPSEVEEEPSDPDWLTGLGEGTEDEDVASSSDVGILDFDEEPEAPAWLTDTEDSVVLPDESPPNQPAASPAAATSTPAGGPSRWVESLRSKTEEAVTDDEDNKTAEATGMLSGISTLLPSEKIAIPAPETGSLNEAAQEFYKIATEAPQPATLPTPLTQRERVVGGAVRSVLYLFFIVLIAAPLLPGMERIVNDLRVPWSEPMGDDADVLDSQRRQLISEQLGIIDLQQPGTTALVSFDYSTATQGEMQPLAEAVVGRLKGQGMRIISMSLEPEGATIAQNTLEDILAADPEQEDQYGIEMINLGYLPGQMAAIRALITGEDSLSTIPDYREKLTLRERSEWGDIQNLDQVDIVVTFADNPTTARWWVEQMAAAPQLAGGERCLLAATSAMADPFLRPYRGDDPASDCSEQLDGLVSGINGAAAIEAGRNRFDSARQMIDSIGIATMVIVILITFGTIVGWMPAQLPDASVTEAVNGRGKPVTADNENESSTQV